MSAFPATVYLDESGIWVAECPGIPGCMSQGPSREAALANLEAVLSGCLAVRAECGMLPSVEIDTVVLVGREVVLLEVDAEDS